MGVLGFSAKKSGGSEGERDVKKFKMRKEIS